MLSSLISGVCSKEGLYLPGFGIFFLHNNLLIWELPLLCKSTNPPPLSSRELPSEPLYTCNIYLRVREQATREPINTRALKLIPVNVETVYSAFLPTLWRPVKELSPMLCPTSRCLVDDPGLLPTFGICEGN